jgi:hypothetical protein
MKKYRVELKYEAYGLYDVEAATPQEAEDKAWEMLNNGQDNTSYGDWSVNSVEERDDEKTD